MTTLLGGVAGQVGLVGFGASTTAPLLGGGLIDTTSLRNMAFSVPADTTITSLSGFFSTTVATTHIGSTVSVTGQLYASSTLDNTFSAVPGAEVTMSPGLTGTTPIGTTSSGLTTGLNIPVTAGTRLLMVYSATGSALVTTVTGNISGGVILGGI